MQSLTVAKNATVGSDFNFGFGMLYQSTVINNDGLCIKDLCQSSRILVINENRNRSKNRKRKSGHVIEMEFSVQR